MGRLGGLSSAIITDDSALGGGEIEKSLRFNDGENAYLTRTPSSTSNRRTFTFSCWVKRSNLGATSYHSMFAARETGTTNVDYFLWWNTDELCFTNYNSTNYDVRTTAKFRDPTSWYHLVLAVDSTQGTAANRVKMYVNGSEVTSYADSSYPSQNYDFEINRNVPQYIGWNTFNYMDGYMAEINFIDGLQLDASYFGFTEFQTGLWRPKGYFGSYNTNGFRLDFSDNSATTAITLGKDRSGQGNDYTPNNFLVSAGVSNDSLIDTPTNTFCTLNTLTKDSNTTLSDGNLQATGSAGNAYNTNTQGTFAESTGKWYYEVEFTSGAGLSAVGWCRTTLRPTDNPTTGGGIVYRPANGDYLDLAGNNPTTPPATSSGAGQIVQVAIDFDAGKIWFGSGGTYFNSGDPSAGTNAGMTFTGGTELLTPVVRTLGCTFKFNFGQRAFSYAAPTDFKTLCSNNIPINTPPIIRPQKHFGVITYSGNGSSPRRISGLEFAPDFVWLKNRNSTNWHRWQDSVNGPNNTLYSNSSNPQAPNESNGHVDAFTEDGFIVDDASGAAVNGGSNTFVAWCWKGGGTPTTTNSASVGSVPTAGSVKIDGANATSALAGTIYPNKMSVNTTAGFSISQYTGTGSSATLAHGLTKTPDITIVKDTGTGADWIVYTKVFDGSNDYIILNSNSAKGNSGLPGVTDTVFNWSGNSSYSNTSGRTYIMYNWTSIPGYSKIGRYSAGGGTDNAYVHTGFRPAFILLRPTSNFGGSDQNYSTWGLWDSTRSTSNVVTYAGMLTANMNSAEQVRGNGSNDGAIAAFDILSDGFKIRGSSYETGYNGQYFFMAFAEKPGNTPFDTEANAQ